MSPQIIEIIIFAAIAYFIITKLISILGSTDEDSPEYKGSKFGEPRMLKEIKGFDANNLSKKASLTIVKPRNIDYSFLLTPKDKNLIESFEELNDKIDSFNPLKFIKNATKASEYILNALKNSDGKTLEELVDSRYLSDILEQKEKYNSFSDNISDGKISDITFFGNNVIIKIVMSPIKGLMEEWAFSKNLNFSTPNWLLSNIENYEK
jgi:predicted lipid-binding transport protein (Tim44 family)